MELIKYLVDLFLHLDVHLGGLINQYGVLSYLFLFIVIFAETGFVVTPFLPGDSLLFTAGAFAAIGKFNIHILFFILIAAAFLGDSINYMIGHFIGPKIFSKDTRFIKKEHLERTHQFYEKHGGITIIIARFIPIIRTFAPFIAGIGKMTYTKFITYNIVGGVLWVALFTYGGYFFGNLDFVKKHFSIVALAIILISLIPVITEFIRSRKKNKDIKEQID